MRRNLSVLLALAACLLLSACGGGARAASMHLRKTEGEVAVFDGKAGAVPLAEGLGLYSGCQVSTRTASYAWIDLDAVKLTKMDEESRVEIQKVGKDLEISLTSGSLFFNVTEPLEDGETMTIRTADLMVGIRGTCGWVDAERKQAALLEGKILCEANGETVAAAAGEKAEVDSAGALTVTPLTAEEVPAFVLEELGGDSGLLSALPEANAAELTLTMPVAARELADCYWERGVKAITIEPGSGDNTLLLDDCVVVGDGCSLTVKEGITVVTPEGMQSYVPLIISGDSRVVIESDLMNNGEIAVYTGVLEVRGNFTCAASGRIWTGVVEMGDEAGGNIAAANGLNLLGFLDSYGTVKGGVTMDADSSRLYVEDGTIDSVTMNAGEIFLSGGNIESLVQNGGVIDDRR